jgi:hypothetical protein
MTPRTNRLDLALDYVARGWAVFPLHHTKGTACSCRGKAEGCKPGKHPRTHNGFYDASTDRRTLQQWWRRWPLANIGIATGAVSSLVVLDVDGEDARRVLDAAMASLGVTLPETWTVRTGDGWHHYFTSPSGLVVPTHNPINPISLQGDRAYVVGVGSIHETGRVYSWEHHLDDRTLAAAPDWLLADDWRREVVRSAKRLGLESLCLPRKGAPPCGAFRSEKGVEGNCSGPPCGAGSASPCFASTPLIPTCKDQEDQEDREDQEDHGWFGETPESLLDHLRLTASGQTDNRFFRLVRGLKLDLCLPFADGIKWVKTWHQRNAEHITHEHDWLIMEDKATRAWQTAKIPLRRGAHMHAARLARVGQSVPEEAMYKDGRSVQFAVRIIANLQALAPTLPFLLSQRQLAEALGHNQHDGASLILKRLQRDGLLDCVHPGTQGAKGLAAKWRYRGALPSLASAPPVQNLLLNPTTSLAQIEAIK